MTPSIFSYIDQNILELILLYLVQEEKNDTLDSCSAFRTFKKNYFFYKLNKEYSRHYWKSKHFREKIQSLICSKKQLSLDLSSTPDIYTISKKDCLDGVFELNLTSCLNLKKVKISDIHCLLLRSCKRLKKIKISHVDVMNIASSCLIRNNFYTWRKLKCLILSKLQYELYIKFIDCLEDVPIIFQNFTFREYMKHLCKEEKVEEIILAEKVKCGKL